MRRSVLFAVSLMSAACGPTPPIEMPQAVERAGSTVSAAPTATPPSEPPSDGPRVEIVAISRIEGTTGGFLLDFGPGRTLTSVRADEVETWTAAPTPGVAAAPIGALLNLGPEARLAGYQVRAETFATEPLCGARGVSAVVIATEGARQHLAALTGSGAAATLCGVVPALASEP